jgi:hypothetical protein
VGVALAPDEPHAANAIAPSASAPNIESGSSLRRIGPMICQTHSGPRMFRR